jgi:hypothetical protein
MNNEFEDGYSPDTEFVDGIDLEDDEDLGIDYHEEMGQIDQINRPESESRIRQPNKSSRVAKIKPMPRSYIKAFPKVQSMLITRFDGRQVLFVRGR